MSVGEHVSDTLQGVCSFVEKNNIGFLFFFMMVVSLKRLFLYLYEVIWKTETTD